MLIRLSVTQKMNAYTFDLKVTLRYYYKEPLYEALQMTSNHGKNYSKVGIILELNEVVVEHEWQKDVLLITPIFLYTVLHILYSILLSKDPS